MSRVAVVGSHGKVGQQILRYLYDSGHEAIGVVRNQEHVEDVFRLGGEAVLFDIESGSADDLAELLGDIDAVVFSAGAGAGSTAERKRTVDFQGSVISATAAARAGVTRFVQISAIGVDEPLADDTEAVWKAYVEAKRDADAALRDTELDWTILRPGTLTNDEGTGLVELAEHTARGSIAREDVAAVVVAVLGAENTYRRSFDLVGGATTIDDAVAALA